MQKKFQAGNLDRKIQILQRIKTKARSGQDVLSWSVFHQCSAHLAPLTETKGSEKNEDIGIHDFSMKTFLIRHKSGITPEMILYYDAEPPGDFSPIDFNTVDFNTIRNKIYNIKSVEEPQNTRRQWLLIDAVYKS